MMSPAKTRINSAIHSKFLATKDFLLSLSIDGVLNKGNVKVININRHLNYKVWQRHK
jgi:hypothetical protein